LKGNLDFNELEGDESEEVEDFFEESTPVMKTRDPF
jgi:hypothetical protein